MSFSSTVKSELCRIENVEDCCLLCELAAAIRICGYFVDISQNCIGIRITTENAAFARRIFSSVKRLFGAYPEISTIKSKKLKKHASYSILLADSEDVKSICDSIGISINLSGKGMLDADSQTNDRKLYKKKACCKKAYLRGAFLAGGSITDPGKTYHMEIVNRSSSMAAELVRLMEGFGLNAKIVKRKGSFVIYIKEGEDIVDFLNIIGAHKALMELENVRILKEVRNNVNRIVNCETANLGKTVNASLRQIENIKFIRDNIGFDALPASLREIAEIRLKYSDANLKELGERLNPPLGKSGVNHRLRKLERIAEKQKSIGNGKKGT